MRMKTQWAVLKPGRIFWTVLAAATLIKIVLSLCTFGTNDVLFFQSYSAKIQAAGGVALYRDGAVLPGVGRPRFHTPGSPPGAEGFFHPPFIVNLLYLLNWFQTLTHLPFPFTFRLLSILADI